MQGAWVPVTPVVIDVPVADSFKKQFRKVMLNKLMGETSGEGLKLKAALALPPLHSLTTDHRQETYFSPPPCSLIFFPPFDVNT